MGFKWNTIERMAKKRQEGAKEGLCGCPTPQCGGVMLTSQVNILIFDVPFVKRAAILNSLVINDRLDLFVIFHKKIWRSPLRTKMWQFSFGQLLSRVFSILPCNENTTIFHLNCSNLRAIIDTRRRTTQLITQHCCCSCFQSCFSFFSLSENWQVLATWHATKKRQWKEQISERRHLVFFYFSV